MDDDDLCAVACPYCGELIEIAVDLIAGVQELIEDCSVCCRPIAFTIRVDAGGVVEADARRDDD